MRKVVILCGSPRKEGNSAALARSLASGAEEGGASVRLLDLGEMDIAPCRGCESCQVRPGSGCVISDQMETVYAAVRESDAVVFAGPVYWFSVSAQTKTAVDRLYAIGGGDANLMGGKSFGIILTYADRDPFVAGAANAVRMFQDMAAYLGAEIKGVVHGSAYAPGDIRSNEAVMAQALELGRELGREKD